MAATTTIVVPDIGEFKDVEVIEVLVAEGEAVVAESPLIALESDKATMEIPSPHAGVVRALKVAVGGRVSEGSEILLLELAAEEEAVVPAEPPASAPQQQPPALPPRANRSPLMSAVAEPPAEPTTRGRPHASPSIRRYARELGVDLSLVGGSGPKGRVVKQDVKQYIKATLAGGGGSGSGGGIPTIAAVDFAKFGEIDPQPLTRIQKLSGKHLHAAWLNVPHVTQQDEADITALEEFRRSVREDAEQRGVRLTPLVFIMKAVVAVLKEFPKFNASIDVEGERLIYKRFYHIGVAVDTPQGLMVPVIRDVDRKGIYELAEELTVISGRAREGRLGAEDLQGGTFSISSLGGIGGTQFTPIVNAPEVAILGVARAKMAPVWNGAEFEPRLMLPLALSYDHRVIDGADGARFITRLSQLLTQFVKVLL